MSDSESFKPLLEVIDVTKQYDAELRDNGPLVLQGINLQVGRGQSLAITGPSGSGKSTLMNIMGTLDRPTEGRILLDGNDLFQLDDQELAVIRNRDIGFIFQAHHLLPQCTALENVLVPTLANPSRNANQDVTRAKDLLSKIGLADRMHHRPGQLSGGERQRVAAVRALINQPKLVLADEPTGALDRVNAEQMMDLLIELNKEQGVTLVVITHAIHLALRLDRVEELCDGKLTHLEVSA